MFAFLLAKGLFHTFSPLLKPIPSPHSPSTVANPTSYFMEKTEGIRQVFSHLLNTKSTRVSTFLLGMKDEPHMLLSKANPQIVLGNLTPFLLCWMHQFYNYLLSSEPSLLGHTHTLVPLSYKPLSLDCVLPQLPSHFHPLHNKILCCLCWLSASFLYIPFSTHSN